MEGNTKQPTVKRKGFNLARTKVKLLAAYYGHPARDLRLICITGATGKTAVAHLVHEILRAANQPVAILAAEEEIRSGILHKFLNDAWKARATYAVITAPVAALGKETFFGLPIYVAAITDSTPSDLNDADVRSYIDTESTLFHMNPQAVILNRDDTHYPDFAGFHGTSETISYGASSDSDLRIDSSKLYRKGTEANLSIGHQNFTVASFLAGEENVSYMACAAAIAVSLNIAPGTIIDGIANYEPTPQNN